MTDGGHPGDPADAPERCRHGNLPGCASVTVPTLVVGDGGIEASLECAGESLAAGNPGCGVVVHDSRGTIVAVNAEALTLLGVVADRLLGQASWIPSGRTVSEEGLPLARRARPVMTTLRSGVPVKDVLVGVQPALETGPVDPGTRWIAVATQRIVESGVAPETTSPDINGVVAVLVDVSDSPRGRRATDRLLHAYRLLADNATDVVLRISHAGIIEWVSPAVRQTLGYDREHLIDANVSNLVHPDDLEILDSLRAPPESQTSRSALQLRLRHASGNYRWMSAISSSAMGEAHGTPAAAAAAAADRIVALRDIDEQMLARRDLAEQQERLHLVLESSRLGLWDWNLQNDEGVVDERWARILGYDLADLGHITSATWDDRVHPDDRSAEAAATELHLRGSVPFHDYEMRMRHRDGHWVWVRDRGKIVKWLPDGTPLRMTGTMEDVSDQHAADDRRVRAEEQFRLAMDYSAIGMCLVSPEGRFLRVNPALCEILGRDSLELQSTSWSELTHPDDADLDLALIGDVLDGTRASYRITKRFLSPDGSVIWGDLSAAAVRNDDGSTRYFVSQLIDVTDRVTSEQALSQSEHLLRVVLDSSLDVIMQFDRELRVEYANRRITEITGIPIDHLIGMTPREAGVPEALATVWEEHVRRVFESGVSLLHDFETDAGQGRRAFEALLVPEPGPDGSVAHVVVTSRDVTSRRVDEAALRHLATHDTLTDLANRAAMLDEVTRALHAGVRSGRSTAVLMVDLDHFKNANDTLGHAAGDTVLRSAAARIESSVRAGDLVARPGGDEFVIVMRDLEDPEEAVHVAQRLVKEFRKPFTDHGGELFSTASIGVAVATLGVEPDELVLEADTAMYAAKSAGRDRVMVFNEALRTAITTRLGLEANLRHALSRGQFEVWYQPEVDLQTGRVIAVEALLRWHHPDGQLYTADRFIEVAEESGLILDIGDWVLHTACSQAAAWARARPDHRLTVRVNVSALQLAEAGLLEALDAALDASQLDPDRLCIEITETALLRETSTVSENTAGIRDRGVRIAVDDFGTAYASLSYLRRYHVDVLKIDRSFVTEITNSDRDRRLVTGIVALAGALGMTVTAEGVESQEQAALLRLIGCPGAQGFLYSEAVPAEQIDELLDVTFPRQ